jgi:linoleoyl-CoA desaturase
MTTIKFSRKDSTKFFKTLNRRVNDYFKENNIKRTGNWKLYGKAIFMLVLLLAPLALILTIELPTWAQIFGMFLTGVGMAGVGMNVMHDANHESFSSR